MKTNIHIPELSLVVLVGTSGSGKSTFAKKHFLGTEVISSDTCRAMVDDDENSLDATQDAFELVHYLIKKRLKRGKLTVVDATNIRSEDRKKLVRIAKEYHVFSVAIVLNIDKKIAYARNEHRPERANMPKHVVKNHYNTLKRELGKLKKEGFRYIFEYKTEEEINEVSISRDKLWSNKKDENGPFDIIGDIHGCFDELQELLEKLGYQITTEVDKEVNYGYTVTVPEGRKVFFVGDLVDRGPASNKVLRLVMSMIKNKQALCVLGNHDDKLKRKLEGRNVQISHGLAETLEQLATEPEAFVTEIHAFLSSLISHYILDNGKLCIAHAGLREEMQGRTSGIVRSFALYGETTGEIDEFGLPMRYNWAKDYKGKTMVVYGHTPVHEASWLNNTMDVDTGCVFGGKLSALRYPEKEVVSVAAKKAYAPLKKRTVEPSKEDVYDDMLYVEDVLCKQYIETPYTHPIVIREENTAAALEVMSRFAVNPKWLAYLPPTMSPSETSKEEGYLEHPKEALKYFRNAGVEKVVCQEKHMGSRAVVIVGKNEEAIQKRFGIANEGIGVILTRTGRAFFKDKNTEQQLLQRVEKALENSGFWKQFTTDWVILDAELMPWSAKAIELLKEQYAAVGTASKSALSEMLNIVDNSKLKHKELFELSNSIQTKETLTGEFTKAYKNYCWEVNSIEDYKLAPFHVLATESKVHTDKNHEWHMETIKSFTNYDEILMATNYKIIEVTNEQHCQEIIDWWLEMTAKGGEGMVVKPYDFIVKNDKGLVQPAVKCRGREYLRIIYGADYTLENNLKRLRSRSLSKKRSMAIKEFSLGLEALNRFVAKDSLRKVHQCVFGVLALESDPVDPRL